METPDSVTRRRALVGGLMTLGAGGGVVYGASKLDAPDPATGMRNETTTPPFGTSSETLLGVDLAGNPIAGTSDARFDLLYWSEYQCPFCQQFESETLPKLIDEDVRSGRLRVIFLEFPYMGADSMTAAVMDRCVWRQVREAEPGRYWRWRSTVYDHQQRKNSGWASKANLLSLTATSMGSTAPPSSRVCLPGERRSRRRSTQKSAGRNDSASGARRRLSSRTPSRTPLGKSWAHSPTRTSRRG